MSLYLFGNMVYGNTNETAVFHGTGAPNLSIPNEPPSSSHLFFLIEPSLEDCPSAEGAPMNRALVCIFAGNQTSIPLNVLACVIV